MKEAYAECQSLPAEERKQMDEMFQLMAAELTTTSWRSGADPSACHEAGKGSVWTRRLAHPCQRESLAGHSRAEASPP
jgi:hypothetical protein